MRCWSVFLGLALAAVALPQRGQRSPDVWVSISIPRYGNAFSPSPPMPRRIGRNPGAPPFQVVIQNRSSRPLEFFTDGNSWGDDTLSFEITGPNGKTTVVRREGMAYTKNFPSTIHLDPGECWIRPVNFAAPSWAGLPKVTGNPIKLSIRAIFAQPNHDLKARKELWSGRAVSAPVPVEWWGR